MAKVYLIAIFALASLDLQATLKVRSYNCENNPDGFVIQVLSEHIIRIKTAAFEDSYYRVLSEDGKENYKIQYAFGAYKNLLNNLWTYGGAIEEMTLTLIQKPKDLFIIPSKGGDIKIPMTCKQN